MADVLELEHISKTYLGPVPTQVLFDINLSFARASFNAIIGGSGSGKSTLLNIMGTLDRASEGEVRIQGQPTQSLTKPALADLRNQTLGFVFQFHFLLPEFSALENVLLPYRIAQHDISAEAEQRAQELMVRMGLEHVMHNPSTRLSGGQQQRTAIARALMNQPALVLADEPTGNLDSESTEATYRLLREIHYEQQTTFVIITHDRHVAEKADRVIEIQDGRITLDIQH